MKKDTSELRESLTKYDLDSGYICKLIKDQIVLNNIIKNYKENEMVLDIGCDTGYFYKLLKNKINTINYTGIDKRNSGLFTNDNFINISAFEYLLTSNSFDYVLLLDVIEHLDNKKNGLDLLLESYNKTNKTLYLSTPNYSAENKINWPKYHNYEYKLSEIINFLEENNIKNYKVYGWSMSNKNYLENENEDYSILPIEIARSISAINNPEKSRDILIIINK